jgi:glycosyltransferase involved in cell wall biosynthesis/GT2 family glycosyltransferase
MPAFDAESTLERAISSVQSQTTRGWQLVVIDDGSRDSTGAIADRYAAGDARIRVLHQTNLGVAAARNVGLSVCTTDHVAFLDADDELLPEYLETMDAFVREHPKYDIYHPNLLVVSETGGEKTFSQWAEIRSSGLDDLLRECVIALGGSVVRADVFRRFGLFREGIHCEDYDLWLRAMAGGARALYLPEPLYVYHQGPHGRRSEDALTGIDDSIRSLQSLLAEGLLGEDDVPKALLAMDEKRELRIRAEHDLHLKAQADTVKSFLVSRLGQRASALVLSLVHSGGRLLMPLRCALVRRSHHDLPDRHERGLRVVLIPSWYPSDVDPTAGVFIREQVWAVGSCVDAAVLYVRLGGTDAPQITHEATHTIARAAVDRTLLDRFVRFRRTGLAVFELLRAQWGTPDIIHVQALWPAGLIARAIKRKYGIPYVVTEHSEEYLPQSERRLVKYPLVVRWLLRPLARGASRTIAVSRHLADRLRELDLTAGEPIVIPNVVPVSEPTSLPLGAPYLIAHVSVMGPAKNLEGLLEAVQRLRERRDDFVLRLVGDGELRQDLERLAAELGVTDYVEFAGRKSPDEVRAILGDSAFTVVSSTHETFSVVAAESLMVGRPVLSTRCGGPEEFIAPQVGELIEAGSVSALVEGLDRMLDRFGDYDPQELHDFAVARFAPEVVAGRILDVYREVLGHD